MNIYNKIYLISFYYLLEIIKLRKKTYKIDKHLDKANNIIMKYNKIIKPYIKMYNESMNNPDYIVKKMVIKPIGIDYKKLAKSFKINYEEIKGLQIHEIFKIINKISIKKREKEILNKKTNYINSIVKL